MKRICRPCTIDGPKAAPKSGAKAKAAGRLPARLWLQRRRPDLAGALLGRPAAGCGIRLAERALSLRARIRSAAIQWFGLEERNAAMMLGGTRAAATILDAFLDAALKARGLDESKLALVGFSQGTMMSLHVGPRRAVAPAAIVGYSGALIAADSLATELKSKPPVLLVHGMADQVVPFAAMGAATPALQGPGACGRSAGAARPAAFHRPGRARARGVSCRENSPENSIKFPRICAHSKENCVPPLRDRLLSLGLKCPSRLILGTGVMANGDGMGVQPRVNTPLRFRASRLLARRHLRSR